MYDAINETMFEFAMTIKHAMSRGWELVEIEYGERRLGIGPRLKIKRGEEERTIYDPGELSSLIQRECYEEDMKKWSSK